MADVTLVLAPVVVSEVDDHKWSGARREKARAKSVIKKVLSLGLSSTPVRLRPGVQALALDVYRRSPRVYRGLEELTYPFHDATITVTHCGRICFKGRKVNLSHALAGQSVGITQVGDRIWLVTFMQYDLGYFDDETVRVEPIDNPFGPKVLPMSPE